MPKFLADARHAAYLKAGVHYDGDVSNLRMPSYADETRAQYDAFDQDGKRAFDLYAAINTAARPDVGGAYVMNTEYGMPGFHPVFDGAGMERAVWRYHWAGVIMKEGVNDVTLESYAVGTRNRTSEEQYAWVDRDWRFQMYGAAIEGQSFHAQHLATGTHGTHASTFSSKVEE